MTASADAQDAIDQGAYLSNIVVPRLAFAMVRGLERQAELEVASLPLEDLLGTVVLLAGRCTLLARPDQTPLERVATRLTAAVHYKDRQKIGELLSWTRSELCHLALVLAARCARPRTRPEDGQVDEIAVYRAAAGEAVLLTHTERSLTIHLMHRRGDSTSQIMRQFLLSATQVKQILDQPVQLELFQAVTGA